MKNITKLPLSDRPRERLLRKGVSVLSDQELLAVILGRGVKGQPIDILSSQLLKLLDGSNLLPSLEQLSSIKGMGPANTALIAAAMEFARRRIKPLGFKITQPKDILPIVRFYADRKQEHFLSISLNGANEILATRVVTVGLIDSSLIHPREVFADPITDRAASVIVAHNHPSGSITPSRADCEVTQKLKQAGDILGIELCDHIIFTHNKYYSFAENDQL